MTSDKAQHSFFKGLREERRTHAAEQCDGMRQELEQGKQVGPFTLTRFIARGGMGQVWEAHDNRLNRNIALKFVLPERIDTRALELFAKEARAGGRLNHPGIVQTLDFGESDGATWIAQELVAGSWTLKDFLDELRASDSIPDQYYEKVAELIMRLAKAIQAAHVEGVIHRDVKPANILITDGDQPKLTDFGLARVADDPAVSVTGDFAGTWAYMSPEQVTAKRIGLDHRTDVFSLGVVLYELLALRRPFEGDTTHQIAEKIIFHDPPRASSVRSQCPPDLASICAKALEKAPSDRYSSAEAFAEDLNRFLGHQPVLASPPSVLRRTLKWIRRNRAAATVIATTAAALTSVSLLSVALQHKNVELNQTALELSATAEDLKAEKESATSNAERALRGQALSAIAGARSALKSGRYREAERLLASCPGEYRSLAWHRTMFEIAPALETFHSGHRLQCLEWSASGTALATGNDDGEILLWTRGSETQRLQLTSDYFQTVLGMRWLAGDRFLAATYSEPRYFDNRGSSLALWDTQSGTCLLQAHGLPELTGQNWVGPDQLTLYLGTCSDGISCLHIPTLTLARDADVEPRTRVVSPSGRNFFDPELGTITDPYNEPASIQLSSRFTDNFEWASEGSICERWNRDESMIATGHSSGRVHLWEAHTGEEYTYLEGHTARVRALAWHPNEDILASGSDDHTVRIWEIETEECLAILRGYDSELIELEWSPDGSTLAGGSLDGTVRIWDRFTRSASVQSFDFLGCGYVSSGACWSPDGTRIAFGMDDGDVCVFDVLRGVATHRLQPSDSDGEGNEELDCIAWSGDGGQIAARGYEGPIRVWSVADEELLLMIPVERDFEVKFSWHPSDDLLAVCSPDDPGLTVWNATTGKAALKIHRDLGENGSDCIAWSPDGTRLAVGGYQHTQVWSFPEGRLLAEDTPVFGYDLQTQPRYAIYEAPKTTSLSWSPDGAWLACGELSGFSILNARDLKKSGSQFAFSGEVSSLGWSPDGTTIATASGADDATSPGSLRLWDSASGEMLLRIQEEDIWQPLGFEWLEWSPDGSRIAFGDGGTLFVADSDVGKARTLWKSAANHERLLREFSKWVDQRLDLPRDQIGARFLLEFPHALDDRPTVVSLFRLANTSIEARLNEASHRLGLAGWRLEWERNRRGQDPGYALRITSWLIANHPDSRKSDAIHAIHAIALLANGRPQEAELASRRAVSMGYERHLPALQEIGESLKAGLAPK